MPKTRKDSNLSIEQRLEQALVPNWDYPYEIPRNWKFFWFTKLIDIEGGTQPPKSNFVEYELDGYIRLVQIRDFSSDKYIVYVPDSDKLRHFNESDILIARYGASLGKICTGLKGVYNVALAKTIFSEKVLNRKYVYWMLHSESFQNPLMAISRTAQAGFNKEDLSRFAMPLPPLEEQERIVKCIDALFAKLDEAKEKAQEVVDNFETRKAAILHKAFSGELTAKWREKNGIAVTSYNKRRFDEVAIIKSNLVDPAEYQDYPHIAPDNIEKKTGVLLEYHTIAEDGVKSGKHRFYPGQILYSKIRPNLSKVVIIDFDGLCSADMYPIEAIGDARCLWYFMLSENFLEQASSAGSRSVLPKINQKELSALTMTIPDSIEEQIEIARIIDNLFAKEYQARESAKTVIEQIDTMKKAILARAFRGELGTNDPSEESAVELLKSILSRDEQLQISTKKSSKRVSIPSDIRALVSNVREEEIIKLLLKSGPQPISIQEIMALSSKKFELMDALRTLEKKQLITKNEFSEYSLTR